MGKLISTTECARRKGVTRQTVSHAIKNGRLKGEQVGRGYVIQEEDCEAWQPDTGQQERARKRWADEEGQPPQDGE